MKSIAAGTGLLLAATAMPAVAWANVFNIDAGDARRTVPIYAAQADVQVLAAEKVLQGQRTNAVRGEMTPGAALDRMVAGSGLQAMVSGPRTVVISRSQARGPALVAAALPREQRGVGGDAPLRLAAQEDAAPQAGGDEIIVTARRVEERLQDVPLAITAVSGDTLTQRGITQVLDVRQTVAGLNITPAAGRTATPIYTIRGQRASDITVTQDPSVAIYVDDVIVTPLHGGNLGLFDLASVQVLKGPQGTLFGRNTTGGAVLFTTQKPTNDLEGYVRVGYGNYDTKTAQGALNVPVADWLRVRAAADYLKNDGFGRIVAAPADSVPAGTVQPGVGKRVRDRDELSLRFTALLTPVDGLDITTSVFHARADSGSPGFRLLNPVNPAGLARSILGPALDEAYARQQQLGDYDIQSNIDPYTRTRIFGVNNTIVAKLSDSLTFKNIFGYRRTRFFEGNDSDGTALAGLEAFNTANFDQYSVETQIQGEAFDNRLNFIFGTYFFDQSGLDFADGTQTFGAKSSIGGRVHNSSFSGFGQATYALTDTLNLTGGLRYSVDRRKFALQNYSGTSAQPGTCNLFDNAGNRLPIDNCVIPVQTSFARPSWLFSIDKKLNPDTMIYLSHRRGYRSGGYALRAFNEESLKSFRPETVSDIELGAKSTVRLGGEWTLTSNLALYYQWYKDIQRSQSFAVDVGGRTQAASIIVNAAKAHIYGGEAEFELRAGREFSLGVNYAYVQPKYDAWPITATIGGVANVPTDYSNREFSGVSKHQVNATVRFSPEIGTFARLNLVGNMYYQSKQYFNDDVQNTAQLVEALSPAAAAVVVPNLRFFQKGYTLVNLRAELENVAGSGLSAAVWAKNVFDKRYIGAGNVFYHTLGIDRFTYGDPRTYGVEVTYRF